MPVLAADIGGTNARFALAEVSQSGVQFLFEHIYATADFPAFEPALDRFLADACAACGGSPAMSRAAIAVAGPVEHGAGRLVNSSWQIDRRALDSRGIPGEIINDFEALAHGVLHAAPEDSIVLQVGSATRDAPRALLGAGSGLGVALLAWDGTCYRPRPSEGGHAGFAPRDELQLELCRYMLERHERVSVERVVSGSGLASIYAFLAAREKAAASPEALEPAEVSKRALAQPGSLAARALDLFVACYGAVAGDIALTFLARGGVYIGGGIAAKLARRLAQPDFIAAFNDKGRHSGLVASIPVRVMTNEKLGLLGAAWAAAAA
jgi:glucokinase